MAAMFGWFSDARFGFALESARSLSVAGHRRWQDFDGDVAFQLVSVAR